MYSFITFVFQIGSTGCAKECTIFSPFIHSISPCHKNNDIVKLFFCFKLYQSINEAKHYQNEKQLPQDFYRLHKKKTTITHYMSDFQITNARMIF